MAAGGAELERGRSSHGRGKSRAPRCSRGKQGSLPWRACRRKKEQGRRVWNLRQGEKGWKNLGAMGGGSSLRWLLLP